PEGGNTSVAAGFGSTEIAAGTYDVEVSTSPRSTFTITVNSGETTTIQLGVQGTIQIVDAAGNLADNYAFYVSPEGENNIIATGFGSTEVAAGTYDVEVNTSPVSTFTVTDRKSTRLNSSHVKISYAVFCLKKKIKTHIKYIKNI